MFYRTLLILSFICLISCTKEIIQQKLTVSVTPTNGGTVSPPSNSYEKGSNVSLVATPAGEYLFKQWQGSISGTSNPTSITMDSDKSVTGVFEKRQYPLTLTIEGSGTVKEEVIAVATQSQYPSGTTVRLTAQPADKFEFGGWKGDVISLTNPLEIKIDKAISLNVSFKAKAIIYPLFKESYLNQRSGMYFSWNDVDLNNPYFPQMNNESNKGYYGGGHSYGDINKDGFQDILASYHLNSEKVELRWYLNKGDNRNYMPTKTPFNQSSIGYNAHKMLKTDVNNDGIADYVALGVDERVPGAYTGNFTVIIGKSNGTFDIRNIPNPNKYWFHNGASGDLNGDGNVDIVSANFIWYGDGTGNFTNSLISTEKYIKSALTYEIIDFNKDGWNDIVASTHANLDVTTIILNNKGTFSESNSKIKLAKMEYIDCLDFECYDIDSDGDLDIIESRQLGGAPDNTPFDAKYGASKLFVHLNNNLQFTYSPGYIQNSEDGNYIHGSNDKNGWGVFKFDDIDADGIDDIITENFHDGTYNGLKKINGVWTKYVFKF